MRFYMPIARPSQGLWGRFKTIFAVVFIQCGVLFATSCSVVQSQSAESSYSRAEIHSVLAPVALYPDTLLTHILIASTYPLEVVQAHRWQQANRELSAMDAVDAAELEGWDPSVAALVAFPDLLERLSIDLEWTQLLGEMFLLDEAYLLSEVQYLRQQAYAAGHLQKMEHVSVISEQKIIYIEPAHRHTIYVPYYDTHVMYGAWWWPAHPPRRWRSGFHDHDRWHVDIYWGPRVSLMDHFFFSAPRWHERRIVVSAREHRRHLKFERARQLSSHHHAHHWHHDRKHRRNIRYVSPEVRKKYAHYDGRKRDMKREVHRRMSSSENNRDLGSERKKRLTDYSREGDRLQDRNGDPMKKRVYRRDQKKEDRSRQSLKKELRQASEDQRRVDQQRSKRETRREQRAERSVQASLETNTTRRSEEKKRIERPKSYQQRYDRKVHEKKKEKVEKRSQNREKRESRESRKERLRKERKRDDSKPSRTKRERQNQKEERKRRYYSTTE